MTQFLKKFDNVLLASMGTANNNRISNTIRINGVLLPNTPTPCIGLVTAIQICDYGKVTVTYVVSSYNPLASGYFNSGTGNITTTQTLTVNVGANLSVTATANAGSTFVGWSTNESIVNPITTSNVFNHVANYNITYYAVMNKTTVVSRSFCYFVSGSTTDYACLDCSTTSMVYFNYTSYYSNPLESITWYANEALTITAPNGLYKINDNSNIPSLTIYSLTGGVPTILGVCGSNPLPCC